MIRDSDKLYLRAAVELAGYGLYSTTPNPRVGCLIVRDGQVLGRGWHVRRGEAHAEINALADADAGERDVRGATAYVSLEPCSFEGLTPACSRALIDARLARVVVAMKDPHPKVAGRGFAELSNAGISVEVYALAEAEALNEGYVSRITRDRPFVRLKVAVSLDARTAMANGESQWITGPAAREDVQAWRARSCAIVTGSQTVLADNPRLTVRGTQFEVDGRIRQPLRVILDSQLRVPLTADVFAQPGTTLIAHNREFEPGAAEAESVFASGARGAAEYLSLGVDQLSGRLRLPELLNKLGERHCNEILIEAGPTLIGAFLEAGLWDELLLYQAPKLLGSDARPLATLPLSHMAQAIEATIVDQAMFGDDVRLRLRPGPAV